MIALIGYGDNKVGLSDDNKEWIIEEADIEVGRYNRQEDPYYLYKMIGKHRYRVINEAEIKRLQEAGYIPKE